MLRTGIIISKIARPTIHKLQCICSWGIKHC